MELSTALLLFVLLLILASVLQRLAARTTLPASILLAAAGALIGGLASLAEHLGWGGPVAASVRAFYFISSGVVEAVAAGQPSGSREVISSGRWRWCSTCVDRPVSRR